jgi:hypothetical protein
MTISELHIKLQELNIPIDRYYLHGLYGSTDDNDKTALIMRMGKYTVEYEVYFKERGQKTSSRIFTSEDQVCNYLFRQIKDGWTFEQINKIDGLDAMTVNERLYLSGLMVEFDNCKTENKTRAKEILRWLRVDTESIEQILK